MSNCVGCGWCCVAFDIEAVQKKHGEACPYLEYKGHGNQGRYTCSINHKKPKECESFSTPGNICAIGAEKMNKNGSINKWITFEGEEEY